MADDRFVELAPDYALGLLEGDELAEFERHLATGCEACEIELERMDTVADALAYAVPAAAPGAALRAEVLAAIQAEPEGASAAIADAFAPPAPAAAARPLPAHVPAPQATYAPAPWPPARAAAATPEPKRGGALAGIAPALAIVALLAAAGTGYYAFRLKQRIALVSGDLERVSAEAQENARVLDVLASPHLETVALVGQGAQAASEGRVLWSPDGRKAVLYAFGLPHAAAGRDYQLWVIEPSGPRSAGVFPVDANGAATYVLPDVPDAATVGGFAVTLEPAGGLPQPSGPMLLLGTVGAKPK